MATRRRFRRQSRHLKKRRSHKYKKYKKSRRNYYNMRGGSQINIDIPTFIKSMKIKYPRGFKLDADNKYYLHVTDSGIPNSDILNFYMYVPDHNPDEFSTIDWLNDKQKLTTNSQHRSFGSVYSMTLNGNELTSTFGNFKFRPPSTSVDIITEAKKDEILKMVGVYEA